MVRWKQKIKETHRGGRRGSFFRENRRSEEAKNRGLPSGSSEAKKKKKKEK